jgi:hypothetical protein
VASDCRIVKWGKHTVPCPRLGVTCFQDRVISDAILQAIFLEVGVERERERERERELFQGTTIMPNFLMFHLEFYENKSYLTLLFISLVVYIHK